MTTRLRFLFVLLVNIAVTFAIPQASAAYPEKPITVIVPYGAGGGSDILVRTFAPYIEKYLGEGAKLVVVNRTGASGVVGWTVLKDSKPDGYTIGIITTPSIVTKPIEGKGSFTFKDFTILANVVTDPGALNVALNSKFKDLKSLVDYAKKNPKVVTVATGNFGGDDHLAMLKFEKLTGAKFTYVPFGGIEARNATMGGHVSAGCFNLGEAVNYRDFVRVLGYMSLKPILLGEGIATFKDQGYDLESSSQRGFAAPAGLPAEIAKKLSRAMKRAVVDPAFIKEAAKQGVILDYMDGPEWKKSLIQFDADMRAIWAESPWM